MGGNLFCKDPYASAEGQSVIINVVPRQIIWQNRPELN